MEDGWGVPQCSYEFLGELENLANYGCFVYEDLTTSPGTTVVGYTNTTDQSETIDSYEGLVANSDAIERYFKDLVGCFEGRTKITLDTLNQLSQEASTGVEFLKTNTVINPIGAILESGVVLRAVQDSDDLVKVILPINIIISSTMEDLELAIDIELAVVG